MENPFPVFFILFPIITYCIWQKYIFALIITELFSFAYAIMIIKGNDSFLKKYYIKIFNLTLFSELLFFLESINIFSNNVIALVLLLAIFVLISVLYIFLKAK